MVATTDPAVLGAKLDRIASTIQSSGIRSAQAAAAVFLREVDHEIINAVGSDRTLSGLGRTSAGRQGSKGGKAKGRMAANAKVLNQSPGSILVGVTGPLQLVEKDVARHVVTSRYAKGAGYQKVAANGKTRKGRSTRESRKASVLFGLGAVGGGRRAVLHWGDVYARYTFASSKGKAPWAKGVAKARPQLAAAHAQAQRQALQSVLAG